MAAILFTIFCHWQNNDIVISRYTYVDLEGFRIAQISDLHNKSFGENNENLIELLEEENPDLIVITGDLVDSRKTDIEVALDFAKEAMEIAPVYYANGNHEERLSSEKLTQLYVGLKESGVIILENDYRLIDIGNGQDFYLVGINNKNLPDQTLKKLMKNLEDDKITVLLAHRPQYISEYAKSEVDLIFSGHAHGGQIILPFIGGVLAPDQGFFPKYTSGKYELNDSTMIVSRGLGNSLFPLRLFNRPDLVIVN